MGLLQGVPLCSAQNFSLASSYYLDSFPFSASSTSLSWNVFIVQPFAASSRPPLLLSETSQTSLLVTLTYVSFSYERNLYLPTSFSILGSARLKNKSKTVQIFLESFCVHLPTHAFFFPQRGSLSLPSLSSLEPAFQYRAHSFYFMLLL